MHAPDRHQQPARTRGLGAAGTAALPVTLSPAQLVGLRKAAEQILADARA